MVSFFSGPPVPRGRLNSAFAGFVFSALYLIIKL